MPTSRLFLFSAVGSLALAACNVGHGPEMPAVRPSVVTIGGKAVPNSLTETPQARRMLYDHLCQMYDIRRASAEAYATAFVVQKEAPATGSRVFLDSVAEARLTPADINATVEREMVGEWIEVSTEEGVALAPTGSARGLEELRRRTVEFLKREFLDSLYSAYDVRVNLRVPQGPKHNLDGLTTETLGDAHAPTVLTVVYDMDCAHCRAFYSALRNLVGQWGARLRVDLVDATGPGLLAERVAAAVRANGSSVAFVDSVMSLPVMLDSLALCRLALSCGVGEGRLRRALAEGGADPAADERQRRLAEEGLLQAPKVLLNSRLLWRGVEVKILSYEVEQALNGN